MGPDTHAPDVQPGLRCPHCAGAVRPQAQWCTQCWADLRPPPEPVAAVQPTVQPTVQPALQPAPDVGSRAASPSIPGSGWPCSGCGTSNAVDLDACIACGTGFLAGLRNDRAPMLTLPVVGDVARLSRAQRLGMAAAVVLVFALLTALLGLLTG